MILNPTKIKNILRKRNRNFDRILLHGTVVAKAHMGNEVYFEIEDESGSIQCIAQKDDSFPRDAGSFYMSQTIGVDDTVAVLGRLTLENSKNELLHFIYVIDIEKRT